MKNKSHKILLLGAILAGALVPAQNIESNLAKGLHNPTTILQRNFDDILTPRTLQNFLPEPEIPKVEYQESPTYDGSRRLDKQTLDEFINFIYENMKISEVIDREFVKSIIEAESERYVYAKSHMGARGLMQLMPATWSLLEKELDFYEEAFNPLTNLRTGIKYLNQLNNDYFETLYPEWNELPIKNKQSMIAAAYNGGIGRLMRNNWDISKMPEETQLYVRKIGS